MTQIQRKREKVARFIRLIRGISPQWLRYAATHGACYRFHLVLKDRFSFAVPFVVPDGEHIHVVSKLYEQYWDIWGVRDEGEFSDIREWTDELTQYMSIDYFDEAYCLNNPSHVRDYCSVWKTIPKEE